jgi:hypothetical protein
MTDDPEHAEPAPIRTRKKRTSPIRVLPPAVVPMSSDDREQAVTALAMMIASWWHDHQHDPDIQHDPDM